jgi:DNA polymerase III beta subunit
MKFKINRDHFSYGLAQVLNVVGSKATMPILSNVLIEAEKDQISLTTTNLDLGIRCKIKAEVKEAGSVTLPVKRLASIIRELPNVDVVFDCSPNHQVKLTSGGSNFRIMGIGKEEFPPLPEFGDEKAFTLEQSELAEMLRSVSYAQSTDETRYILNGVYFNFRDGKLALVATDGRRLALRPWLSSRTSWTRARRSKSTSTTAAVRFKSPAIRTPVVWWMLFISTRKWSRVTIPTTSRLFRKKRTSASNWNASCSNSACIVPP